jgi:NitT/TauT family transport system permease protein
VTAATSGRRPGWFRLSPPRGVRTPGPRHLTPAQRWTLRLTSVVVVLGGWQLYGLHHWLITSYPTAVAVAFVDTAKDGTLLHALWSSLTVLGVGFSTSAVAGVLLGVAAGRSEIISALLELPLNALNAIPAVTLIPLFVLLFGFQLTSKSVIVFLFVFFPVFFNTVRGVREVDPELIEVARSFCSSERRMWADLIIPSALPYVVTGLRLAIGRALIGVIVAEFYTALSGLGFLITTNASNSQPDRMFVPIVVIALIGIILTALLEWAERRMVKWRKTS